MIGVYYKCMPLQSDFLEFQYFRTVFETFSETKIKKNIFCYHEKFASSITLKINLENIKSLRKSTNQTITVFREYSGSRIVETRTKYYYSD